MEFAKLEPSVAACAVKLYDSAENYEACRLEGDDMLEWFLLDAFVRGSGKPLVDCSFDGSNPELEGLAEWLTARTRIMPVDDFSIDWKRGLIVVGFDCEAPLTYFKF